MDGKEQKGDKSSPRFGDSTRTHESGAEGGMNDVDDSNSMPSGEHPDVDQSESGSKASLDPTKKDEVGKANLNSSGNKHGSKSSGSSGSTRSHESGAGGGMNDVDDSNSMPSSEHPEFDHGASCNQAAIHRGKKGEEGGAIQKGSGVKQSSKSSGSCDSSHGSNEGSDGGDDGNGLSDGSKNVEANAINNNAETNDGNIRAKEPQGTRHLKTPKGKENDKSASVGGGSGVQLGQGSGDETQKQLSRSQTHVDTNSLLYKKGRQSHERDSQKNEQANEPGDKNKLPDDETEASYVYVEKEDCEEKSDETKDSSSKGGKLVKLKENQDDPQNSGNDSDDVTVLSDNSDDDSNRCAESQQPMSLPTQDMIESPSKKINQKVTGDLDVENHTTKFSQGAYKHQGDEGQYQTADKSKEKRAAPVHVENHSNNFTVKKTPQGKIKIKSNSCGCICMHKPNNAEIVVDEDDILYDGDDCWMIIMKDKVIKLEQIGEAKIVGIEEGSKHTNTEVTGQNVPTVDAGRDLKPRSHGGEKTDDKGDSLDEVTNNMSKLSITDHQESGDASGDNLKTDAESDGGSLHGMKKSDVFKLRYFCHNILNDPKFKEQMKNEFPNVEVGFDADKGSDNVSVIVGQADDETLKAVKIRIQELIDNIAVVSTNFSNCSSVKSCADPVESIRLFVKGNIEDDSIKYDINEIAKTIWMWSVKLPQSKLDQLTKKVKDGVSQDRIVVSYHEESAKGKGEYSGGQIQNKTPKHQGTKDASAEQAKSVQKRQAPKPPTGNSPTPPVDQKMDRGSGSSGRNTNGMKWSRQNLEEFEGKQPMVQVTNVSNKEEINAALRKCKINNKGVIFLDETNEALLSFRYAADADKFVKECPQNLKCKKSKDWVLGRFVQSLKKSVWEKWSSDLKKWLRLALEKYGINLEHQNDQVVLRCHTLSQMKTARSVLGSIHQDITLGNLDAPKWLLLQMIYKDRIREIETVKYLKENSELRIPAVVKCVMRNFDELTDAIANLKDKEIIELPVPDEELDKVQNACKEVEKQKGYQCCVLDEAGKTVFIYDESYEETSKCKNLFEIKIGWKKPTGRGRRGTATVVNSPTDEKTYGRSQGPSIASSSSSTPSERKQFTTREGIKVFVYKADIKNLEVDCIVNAANSSLNHGGGIAAVISKAAGNKFEKDCKEYLRKNKTVPVGEACSTSAGDLRYKRVIHAVGPRWSDYDKHTREGKKKCEDDLINAVLSALREADKEGMDSVALPAISSAIFGVPIGICVKQYVRAVQTYSATTKDKPHVSEIHFIDINPATVSAIQDAFANDLTSLLPQSDSATAVDLFTETVGDFDAGKVPEPLMFEKSMFEHEFYFMGNSDDNMLLLRKGDMESLSDVSALVVPVDKQGHGGKVYMDVTGSCKQKYSLEREKNRLLRGQVDVGSVLKSEGFGCRFDVLLYAVYPRQEKSKTTQTREESLRMTLQNALEEADRDTKIESVTVPTFGIDPDKEEDVKLFSRAFIETYKGLCEQKLKEKRKSSLKFIVMCYTEEIFKTTRDTFVAYVQRLKSKDSAMEDKGENSSINDESLEQCVICMDTITDPKTIQCGHTFCTDCIDQQFAYKKQCPTCGKPCGIITGDQPYGTMTIYVDKNFDVTGYEGCGSIKVTYIIPGGRQQENHPEPGKYYRGINRSAYLPNNEEGRKVLKMLQVAFDRKLVFTIGNSRTTGQTGVVTWNDIHHKTDPRPYSQFGYPDPTYLERVKDELAAKGVTEADIE